MAQVLRLLQPYWRARKSSWNLPGFAVAIVNMLGVSQMEDSLSLSLSLSFLACVCLLSSVFQLNTLIRHKAVTEFEDLAVSAVCIV